MLVTRRRSHQAAVRQTTTDNAAHARERRRGGVWLAGFVLTRSLLLRSLLFSLCRSSRRLPLCFFCLSFLLHHLGSNSNAARRTAHPPAIGHSGRFQWRHRAALRSLKTEEDSILFSTTHTWLFALFFHHLRFRCLRPSSNSADRERCSIWMVGLGSFLPRPKIRWLVVTVGHRTCTNRTAMY